MIFMTNTATIPHCLYAHAHTHKVDGVEIQRVPDQRQNELLAEFERRKKVSHINFFSLYQRSLSLLFPTG